MHNNNDTNVPFTQASELFTALRRLNKKVTLIQYKDEDHLIINTKSQFDFTVKQQQFFNYYLKDELPPKWITSD
jgi:dipeptidyl aminopeptidase/acylaminoacyl peptidase